MGKHPRELSEAEMKAVADRARELFFYRVGSFHGEQFLVANLEMLEPLMKSCWIAFREVGEREGWFDKS